MKMTQCQIPKILLQRVIYIQLFFLLLIGIFLYKPFYHKEENYEVQPTKARNKEFLFKYFIKSENPVTKISGNAHQTAPNETKPVEQNFTGKGVKQMPPVGISLTISINEVNSTQGFNISDQSNTNHQTIPNETKPRDQNLTENEVKQTPPNGTSLTISKNQGYPIQGFNTLDMPAICPNTSLKVSAYLNGRLGNQIWEYASLYGISRSACRVPSIGRETLLKEIFPNLTIPLTFNGSAAWQIEEKSYAIFDETLIKAMPPYECIEIKGYRQSYKYFEKYQDDIRKEFHFKEELAKSAKIYLSQIERRIVNLTGHMIKQNVTFNLTFVGVHVRLGDIARGTIHGYLSAGIAYFKKAMEYFRTKYTNVHFIVASDDIKWTLIHLNFANVTFTNQAATLDFAILSHCDHVIMSVGTFGWWAGWLAGGEVTYRYPQVKPGSKLCKQFRKEDFFPPHWIGIEE